MSARDGQSLQNGKVAEGELLLTVSITATPESIVAGESAISVLVAIAAAEGPTTSTCSRVFIAAVF
jgi:hypothetical protein